MKAGFTWLDGERLIRFGDGAVGAAPELLRQRGFDGYALLTTRRALAGVPALGEGAAAVLEVPSGAVPEAAAAVRERAAGRPLVALGGGRVIDSAKAIAGVDGLACAAVPTTLSGAEMTHFHRMPAGVDRWRLVRPSLVVAEPALMASQPMPELAASAMNALGHAVEALYVPLANPVADMAALRAAELIAGGLSGAPPGRGRLALGGLLAGYAVGLTGFAVHHAVCQTIVRVARTPHAQTNAVMLPHSLRLMVPRAPEELRLLAEALAPEEGSEAAVALGREDAGEPRRAVERVRALAAQAGVTRLSELGAGPDVIAAVVSAVLERPELHNTPDPPDEGELTALLEAAM